MNPDIRVYFDGGIVRMAYRGEAVFALTNEAIREAARIGIEHDSPRLLVDISEVTDRSFHVRTIQHAEMAPELGLGRNLRIAVVSGPEDDRLSYIEDVAVNRGLNVKAFTDDAAAVAWLLADD
jgi:hypothetical protein